MTGLPSLYFLYEPMASCYAELWVHFSYLIPVFICCCLGVKEEARELVTKLSSILSVMKFGLTYCLSANKPLPNLFHVQVKCLILNLILLVEAFKLSCKNNLLNSTISI